MKDDDDIGRDLGRKRIKKIIFEVGKALNWSTLLGKQKTELPTKIVWFDFGLIE